MRVKANYVEMNEIGTYVFQKSEELEKNLKESLELINSINSCWDGIDADNFIFNSSTYINNMGITVNELKNISNLIKNIARRYEHKDLLFESEIKKEGLYDEKY